MVSLRHFPPQNFALYNFGAPFLAICAMSTETVGFKDFSS